MTKKQKHIASIESVEPFDLSSLNEWISKYGKSALLVLLLCVASFFLLFRFGFFNSSQGDFLKAENAFSLLSKEGNEDKTALLSLEKILNAHPELQPKYDGIIAQMLLNRNEVEASIPFATRAIKWGEKEGLSLFTDFSKGSLLLAQGKLEDAFSLTMQLKEKILEKPLLESEEVLLGFTLLRIAFLGEKLEKKEDAKSAWESIQKLPTRVYQKLEAVFTTGNMSLTTYMNLSQSKVK